MVCLFVIVIVPLAARADVPTIRELARGRVAPVWWVALATLFTVGVAAGAWSGFYCEYQLSDQVRVFSFPVPVGIYRLEDNQWVDYVTHFPVLIASFNAVGIALVSLLPLSGAYFTHTRWSQATRRHSL